MTLADSPRRDPPKFRDRVHVVWGDFSKHMPVEIREDVGEDCVLRHYVPEGAAGMSFGPVPFAASREQGTWHWPGGYGCEVP